MTDDHSRRGLARLLVLAVLLLGCVGLEYWAHIRYGLTKVYPHFFYVPLLLAAVWWGLKGGLLVALFLSLLHVAAYLPGIDEAALSRAVVFACMGSAAGILSGRRKQAEERLERLNRVLRAIRNVNQLITRERDRDTLLKAACDSLVVTRGYHNAWIAVLDEAGMATTTAEAGLGKAFLPLVERLKSGALPDCARRAAEQPGAVATEDPASACADCPLAADYRGRAALTARLECRGRVYGLLSASVPARLVVDEEELSLFAEVAADIALALHNMQSREERRRAEAALRESEARFRSLVETTSDWVWEVDQRGVYTYASPRVRDLLGYEPQEVIGKTPFDLMPPSEAECVAAEFEAAVQARRPLVRLENTNIHKDGRSIVLETSGVPVFDASGDFMGYRGIDRDITERKRAEEALRRAHDELEERVEARTAELAVANEALQESEEKYHAVFDQAADSVVLIDTQTGALVDFNDRTCEALGYTREEFATLTISDFAVVESPEDVGGHVSRILEKRTDAFETRLRTKEGETRYVLVRSRVISIRGTEIILSIWRDITERQRAEAEIQGLNEDLQRRVVELDALNAELESFSHSVSHDLRGPLRAAQGFGKALLEDCADALDEKGKHYVERITAGCHRMSELIEDLLRLSRVIAAEMSHETVDLSELAREVAAELRKGEPEREVEFTIPDGLVAEGDRGLLRILLERLLGNAWKFTSKHPTASVELGATTGGDGRVFFVRDDGAGLDMQYAYKLFAPFQRLHSQAEFPGTGIGLATVQRIVRRHGGRVWVEAAVEQGATFYFTL